MAQTAPRAVKTATVAAQDTWTDWLSMSQLERASVSIRGNAFTGTVTLQRMLDQSIRDVKTYAGVDAEESYDADERCQIRLGVKTGDFAGTSVDLRVAKG